MDSTMYLAIAIPVFLFSYVGYLWIKFEIDERKNQDTM